MKIEEIIINEMPNDRPQLIKTVTGIGGQIIFHIFKYFLMPYPETREYWVKEIDRLVFGILDDTMSLPFDLKPDNIYTWAVRENKDLTTRKIEATIKKWKIKQYNTYKFNHISVDELVTMTLPIMKSLSHGIHDRTFTSIREYLK